MSFSNQPPRPGHTLGDTLFRWICQSAGLFVIAVILGLVGVLIDQSWAVLSSLREFKVFSSAEWNPNATPPIFGSFLFIYGTLATSLIAMLIGVPLGVGSAAFLSEIAPDWVRRSCSFMIELLAAIPSVVYGFWGLIFLAPLVSRFFEAVGGINHASGQGIFCAGLILAIMIVPYIIAISYDVCRAVPRAQREAALALGATRWQMIRTVVLPYARPGIIAACFLALGRALGETMAVTMLIGNIRYLDFSPFASGDSIASIIANQLKEAGSDHRAALITLGLTLFVITGITNISARFLIARAGRPRARKVQGIGIKLPLQSVIPHPELEDPRKGRRRARRWNTAMTWILAGCQVCTILPLFLILGYITYRGLGGLNLSLFLKAQDVADGGLGHAMLGSLYMVGYASAFAVPVGVLAAIFLAEYRGHRLTKPIRLVTEILGGVPSIVIGIFAYAVLVKPFWATIPWGFSGWAGSFALGVMMLPVVIRTSEEAMRLVPNALREASYALGATQWQTVLRVILPASIPAITTGILLAMSRIAGETAPLLFTARGSSFWPQSMSDQTPFLTDYIYNYSKNSVVHEQDQAWAASFVLVFFILGVNVTIRLLAGKRQISATGAG